MFKFFNRKPKTLESGGITFTYDLDNTPVDNPIIVISNARGESISCTEEEVRDVFTKAGVTVRRLNKINKNR